RIFVLPTFLLIQIASVQSASKMELYRQVSHTTHEVLALPPKYLRMYGDFVTKNASAVGQIEGALRSLTYILPGTFDSCWAQQTNI
ncbi:hypothetical protein KCU84_g23564, partial [Aureobasidium melanogenum]